MRNMKTKTILFSGLLAILAPFSGFSQEPSKTAQSGTAKLQVTQCALKVCGMTCGGCAGMVEKNLPKLDRITTAKVDYKIGEAQVEFDAKKTTPEKIVAAFNQVNSGWSRSLPLLARNSQTFTSWSTNCVSRCAVATRSCASDAILETPDTHICLTIATL